jgi:hypothetical protein
MLVMAIKAGSYANEAHIEGRCGFIKVGHLYFDEERKFLSSGVSSHHTKTSHLSSPTALTPNEGGMTLSLVVG